MKPLAQSGETSLPGNIYWFRAGIILLLMGITLLSIGAGLTSLIIIIAGIIIIVDNEILRQMHRRNHKK